VGSKPTLGGYRHRPCSSEEEHVFNVNRLAGIPERSKGRVLRSRALASWVRIPLSALLNLLTATKKHFDLKPNDSRSIRGEAKTSHGVGKNKIVSCLPH
jgi:hypothetical protein